MSRIEFTDFEKEVVKKHIKYRLGFDTPIEEVKAMNAIIERAEALQDELDAVDEVMEEPDCDLVLWYWKQYLKQEGLEYEEP